MRQVFVDTLYWIAVTRPGDQWGNAAQMARRQLGRVRLVTTEEVLTEFTNALSNQGPWLRRLAGRAVSAITADLGTEVVPQSHLSFVRGLDLHARRPDKGYSLTDCVSMVTMREHYITEILTHDEHFEQEGFVVLIGGPT